MDSLACNAQRTSNFPSYLHRVNCRKFIVPNFKLQDCLAAFTHSEALDEESGFTCDACKRRCAARKRLTICRCPPVLVLMLKRFSAEARLAWSVRAGSLGKNSVRVGMQVEELDLRPFCGNAAAAAPEQPDRSPAQHAASTCSGGGGGIGSGGGHPTGGPCSAAAGRQLRGSGNENGAEQTLYNLAAVSHHSGGLDGGHYTAQCRHPGSREWHNFNDAAVSDTVPSAVSASAYVLFYTRQQ